jgi:diaminopimelate decarboxylase
MANTYNSRALVPEVMVNGDQWAIVAIASIRPLFWRRSRCRTG